MTITYHPEVVQGSEEWAALRRGLITASEMKLILTPTLKIADNDKCRAHLWELLAQRITGYVEPSYISDDMLRGINDEAEAVVLYAKNHVEDYSSVTRAGFITNDSFGFTIGYSPDALVGDEGLLECKSRRQKYQMQTIAENAMPLDYLMQVQTGLLVSGRQWLDFVSYSGGLPMLTIRVYPDPKIQAAIVQAAETFEAKIAAKMKEYQAVLGSDARLVATERKIVTEMYIGGSNE